MGAFVCSAFLSCFSRPPAHIRITTYPANYAACDREDFLLSSTNESPRKEEGERKEEVAPICANERAANTGKASSLPLPEHEIRVCML